MKRPRMMPTRPAPQPAVDPYANRVTVGTNLDVKQIALIFGDPTAEPPNFVTFTPSQARELAQAMLREADKVEGKVSDATNAPDPAGGDNRLRGDRLTSRRANTH